MMATAQALKRTTDRPAIPGAEGEPWWLITGQESLDELRGKIIQLSQNSQSGSTSLTSMPGPFHIMGSLSYTSLTTLVSSLSRDACLDLFRMEQNYRSRSTAPRSGYHHCGAC